MESLTKTSLSKMSVSELEGKLIEVKENFKASAMNLNQARQNQILKGKAIRGKTSERKSALISQILKIQQATNKNNAAIKQINVQNKMAYQNGLAAAARMVEKRREELRRYGEYMTRLSNKEKVMAWAYDMDIDKDTLDILVAAYGWDGLAAMSGDEFYDQAQYTTIAYNEAVDKWVESVEGDIVRDVTSSENQERIYNDALEKIMNQKSIQKMKSEDKKVEAINRKLNKKMNEETKKQIDKAIKQEKKEFKSNIVYNAKRKGVKIFETDLSGLL